MADMALGFEQIREILRETSEKNREAAEERKETERILKEVAEQQKGIAQRQEETDRIVKENARQIKDLNKRFGEFTNRFGEVVEYMIAPNLQEKFREFGFDFIRANSNPSIADHTNNIFLEVDILLENTDKAMLTEVKTKLDRDDVKDHIKRLEKMRNYANLHSDKRVFLGAVAGVIMTAEVKKYALGQGLYVIEPSGETFNITPPYGKPKEW